MKRILIAVLLTLWCVPAWAAIAFVQVNGTLGDSSAQTSRGITVTAPSAGNFCVLACACRIGTANTFSNVTQTNVTWIEAVEINSSANASSVAIWYAENVGASAGTTVTVTSASCKAACAVLEYSGVATSSSLDTETGTWTTASATTFQTCISGTDCPTSGQQDQADEVMVAALGARTTGTWATWANGYTERADVQTSSGSPATLGMAGKIVSAAEEAFTSAASSTSAGAGAIARFKAAGGAPPAVSKPSKMVVFQ